MLALFPWPEQRINYLSTFNSAFNLFSAISQSLGSVGLAVLFGLGTTISPILVLGGLTGWLLNKAPLLRKWISVAGAGILIVLGISALINSGIHL